MRWARARAPRHGLRRAAGALAVGGRVGPQLERHGHYLVAGVERELGGGGAVDPAAHGHQRAARVGRERAAPARAAAPSARWSASAARAAAWRLRGDQSAERVGDVVRGEARGVEERRALDQLDHGAAGGAGGAAALGVEARLGDAVALDRTATRTRSPQAAPPAAPAWGQSRERSKSARRREVVLEVHPGAD